MPSSSNDRTPGAPGPEGAHAAEVRAGARFEFGANWARFLSVLDDRRIALATQSLRDMLAAESLSGKSFLDIGSGSGLFSLAARRLGARVRSFDYDPQSVACTRELQRRYFPGDPDWVVEAGSVLDGAWMAGLGRFDVVYSWGVLHHTGRMHEAFAHAAAAVQPGGLLFIAIYNDQGLASRYWTWVKRTYNRGAAARVLLTALHAPYLFAARWLVRAATGRLALDRGMSLWHDMVDWLGGYPFEVATPSAIEAHFGQRGFTLLRSVTVGRRMGCNEYVFRAPGPPGDDPGVEDAPPSKLL